MLCKWCMDVLCPRGLTYIHENMASCIDLTMSDDVSRSVVIYGHSFPARLWDICENRGIYGEHLFGRPHDRVYLDGYRGLLYDRIQARSDWYLHNLFHREIDVFCVDMGSNDLCYPDITPAVLCGKVHDFMELLRRYRIRPKATVFLSVLCRTWLMHVEGQINNIDLFNARVAEYNVRLQETLAPLYPSVRFWSQEAYNRDPFLDGCHLTPAGVQQQIGSLSTMISTMVGVVNGMG